MEDRSVSPPPGSRPAGMPDTPYVAEARARTRRDEAIAEFFTKLGALAEVATEFLKEAIEAEEAEQARRTQARRAARS